MLGRVRAGFIVPDADDGGVVEDERPRQAFFVDGRSRHVQVLRLRALPRTRPCAKDVMQTLAVLPRYAGFPNRALGAYVGGVMAARADARCFEVTLRRPVPVTEVIDQVRSSQPYILQGWPIRAEGRRRFAGAAMFTADGKLVARSLQTCVVAVGGAPLGARGWRR